MLQNLLINAAQAKQGRGTVARDAARRRRLALASRSPITGPGIPAEIRAALFRPFKTTKARGTGLGMATAKRLIESQDGTIAVDVPAGGRHDVITLTIPAAPADATSRYDGFSQLELLDAVADLIAVEAEQRRRLGLVPAAALQRLHDQRSLERLEVDALGRQAHRRRQLAVARRQHREVRSR